MDLDNFSPNGSEYFLHPNFSLRHRDAWISGTASVLKPNYAKYNDAKAYPAMNDLLRQQSLMLQRQTYWGWEKCDPEFHKINGSAKERCYPPSQASNSIKQCYKWEPVRLADYVYSSDITIYFTSISNWVALPVELGWSTFQSNKKQMTANVDVHNSIHKTPLNVAQKSSPYKQY